MKSPTCLPCKVNKARLTYLRIFFAANLFIVYYSVTLNYKPRVVFKKHYLLISWGWFFYSALLDIKISRDDESFILLITLFLLSTKLTINSIGKFADKKINKTTLKTVFKITVEKTHILG